MYVYDVSVCVCVHVLGDRSLYVEVLPVDTSFITLC